MKFLDDLQIRDAFPRLIWGILVGHMLYTADPAAAQRVHQLPATPSTVAYGYYWSLAKPAITIDSGDLVEVETMLTNTPAGLELMGLKPEDVPRNLRDVARCGSVAQDERSGARP
jgi:hypothetical protein